MGGGFVGVLVFVVFVSYGYDGMDEIIIVYLFDGMILLMSWLLVVFVLIVVVLMVFYLLIFEMIEKIIEDLVIRCVSL